MHTFLGDGLACLGGSALAIGVAPAVLPSALGGARLQLSACQIEKWKKLMLHDSNDSGRAGELLYRRWRHGSLHNGSCLAASSLHNGRNGISLEGDTEASPLAKLPRS